MNNEEQVNLWTESWANSLYTMQDLLDGDKWVSVKDSPMLPAILKYLSPGSNVIEAGCGMGHWVIYLADKGYKIKGIDYAADTITKLKNDFPKYEFEYGNVLAFNIGDNMIDGVLSWGVVEHFIEGPHEALKETYRILKKGGYLFISVPCKNNLNIILSPINFLKGLLTKNNFIQKILSKKPYKKSFFEHRFRKNVFKKYLLQSGFKTIEAHPFSQEMGLANEINRTFNLKRTNNWLHKNKTGKWDKLTKTGQFFCNLLKSISPWFTSDFMYFVARKN
jgi:ubiquinone/menaquinone biosynthesis C-methylase UbiE